VLLILFGFAPAEFQLAYFRFQKVCNSSFVTNGPVLLHCYKFLYY